MYHGIIETRRILLSSNKTETPPTTYVLIIIHVLYSISNDEKNFLSAEIIKVQPTSLP